MFITHADWQATFDNDPNQTIATRHKVYDMAATEKLTVVGYHFPYPCVGHVEKDGAGYRLIPGAWDPNGEVPSQNIEKAAVWRPFSLLALAEIASSSYHVVGSSRRDD
jgi:hypothetical protein